MDISAGFNNIFQRIPFFASSKKMPHVMAHAVENCEIIIKVFCYPELVNDVWVAKLCAYISSPDVNIISVSGLAHANCISEEKGTACGRSYFEIKDVKAHQQTNKHGAELANWDNPMGPVDSVTGSFYMTVEEMTIEVDASGNPVLHENNANNDSDEESDDPNGQGSDSGLEEDFAKISYSPNVLNAIKGQGRGLFQQREKTIPTFFSFLLFSPVYTLPSSPPPPKKL